MPPLETLPELTAPTWALLGTGALIVGLSKTALPGAATVSVGLFALALPAKESTAALLLLLLVGDAMALWIYRGDPDVVTLLRLIPSVLAGIVLGAAFFVLVEGATVQRVIGIVLLGLVVVALWQRRTRAAHDAGGEVPDDALGARQPSRAVGASTLR